MPLVVNTLPRDEDEMEPRSVGSCEGRIAFLYTIPLASSDEIVLDGYSRTCIDHATDCVIKKPFSAPIISEDFRMRLMEGLDAASEDLFRRTNSSADFLIGTIEEIIASYEQLPVSYNSVMIRGALRYCAKLLGRVEDLGGLLKKIKKFILLVNTLRCQFENATTFVHLDLTYIENMFETIEEEAVVEGYLPPVEDMPI